MMFFSGVIFPATFQIINGVLKETYLTNPSVPLLILFHITTITLLMAYQMPIQIEVWVFLSLSYTPHINSRTTDNWTWNIAISMAPNITHRRGDPWMSARNPLSIPIPMYVNVNGICNLLPTLISMHCLDISCITHWLLVPAYITVPAHMWQMHVQQSNYLWTWW